MGAAAAAGKRVVGRNGSLSRRLDYPRTTVVTHSSHVRLSLLATGRFLAIFSASALRFPTGRSEIKVLPIELQHARVPIGIANLNHRTLSPVAQLFIETARKVATPLAKVKAKTGSDGGAL